MDLNLLRLRRLRWGAQASKIDWRESAASRHRLRVQEFTGNTPLTPRAPAAYRFFLAANFERPCVPPIK
jgi:hypothetical protein